MSYVASPAPKSFFFNDYVVFERVKASASYGIAAIHYEIILPLKGRIIGLTDDQRKNLDFYNIHKELCSEIRKVEFVFWQYTYAQADVRKAATPDERTEASVRALATGKELVAKYDALIQFAMEQAFDVNEYYEDEYLSKTEYLGDLHEVLDGKKHGQIYNTVNTFRAKAGFEANPGIKDKNQLKAAVKKEYLRFVTEFVSNVQEAQLKAGNTSPHSGTTAVQYGFEDLSLHVTKAFIKGLADTSELEQDLTIIELYDELTNQQNDVCMTEAQDDVIQHFQGKIEELMHQAQAITAADLQGIQFKGISLMSVLKSSGVKQLNDLKALKERLQTNQSEIANSKAIIEGNKQIIARPVNYSFNDVQVFLNDLAEEDRIKLEGIPKDDTVLGRFATLYTEAFEEHAALTKQITELTEIQTQAKTARAQEITANREEVVTAQGEIDHLKQQMELTHTALENKEKELKVLREGIAKKEKELASEKEGSDLIQNDLNKMILSRFKEDTANRVQRLEEEFDDLNNRFNGMHTAWSMQTNRLPILENALIKLEKEDDVQNKAEALLLQKLNKKLEKVKKREIAKLSGEDIKAVARHFGIAGKTASENSLARQLNNVLDAEARVKSLEDNLPQSQIEVEAIQRQVSDLEGAMFSEAKKSAIADQLRSNLDIAKHVTMTVGKCFADQQELASLEVLALAKKSGMPLEKIERASVFKETELQREFKIRQDGDENKLNVLVKDGLGRFVSGVEPIQRMTFPVIDRSLPTDDVLVIDAEEDSDREPEKGIV